MAEPLVPAATELRCFGALWCGAGTAALAGFAFVVPGEVDRVAALALGVALGVSLFAAVAGLVLARRTGPAILYRRIFDRAPPVPRDAPREQPRETLVRVVPSALVAVAALVPAGAVAHAGTFVVLGGERRDVLELLPASALGLGGAWVLAAGAAALQVAHYFRRWERAKRKVVLCRPLRAGLMRHVYVVADA